MFSAEIMSSEPFAIGKVERLFNIELRSYVHGRAGYDVTRDGRFLLQELSGRDSSIRELQVVTDLFEVFETRDLSAVT